MRMFWIALLGATAAATALTLAPPAIAQTTGGLSGQLDEAERKLDADIRACRPIDVNDYFRLQSQASANFRAAQKAQKAGMPVDTAQLGRFGARNAAA